MTCNAKKQLKDTHSIVKNHPSSNPTKTPPHQTNPSNQCPTFWWLKLLATQRWHHQKWHPSILWPFGHWSKLKLGCLRPCDRATKKNNNQHNHPRSANGNRGWKKKRTNIFWKCWFNMVFFIILIESVKTSPTKLNNHTTTLKFEMAFSPKDFWSDHLEASNFQGSKLARCFNWRFYPGTLEWYPNPCFGGLTPIYPHFNTILRDF